jgi:hypothetical protein
MIKVIIIIVFKTQLGDRPEARLGLRVDLTIDPSQYKDTNDYYIVLKLDSGST